MTRQTAARSGIAAPRISPAGRWISGTAAATVVALAGIAGAISYSHMRQLAQDHGQARWHAHAFPLSVDGVEIVASLVLLAGRRAGRRSGWLPWAALAIGCAGSLAANVATAGPGTVSRLIAGWPALALLLAVKLLSGMLDRDCTDRPTAVPSRPASKLRTPETGTMPRPAKPRRPGRPTSPMARQGAARPVVTTRVPARWAEKPSRGRSRHLPRCSRQPAQPGTGYTVTAAV